MLSGTDTSEADVEISPGASGIVSWTLGVPKGDEHGEGTARDETGAG